MRQRSQMDTIQEETLDQTQHDVDIPTLINPVIPVTPNICPDSVQQDGILNLDNASTNNSEPLRLPGSSVVHACSKCQVLYGKLRKLQKQCYRLRMTNQKLRVHLKDKVFSKVVHVSMINNFIEL